MFDQDLSFESRAENLSNRHSPCEFDFPFARLFHYLFRRVSSLSHFLIVFVRLAKKCLTYLLDSLR